MKDLNRLLDEPGTDPLEVNLLRLARNEGPSGESRRRILAGLGMGVAAGTISETSGAAQSAGAGTAVGSAALKWGIAAVVAVGVSVVAFLSMPPQAQVTSVTSVTSVTPVTSVTSDAPTAGVALTSAPSKVATPATATAPGSADLAVPVTKVEDLPTLSGAPDAVKGVSTPSLAEEVAALRIAKAALASGDAAESLRDLDAYRIRFPRGRLAQEASVVRIEALFKSGNQAAANAAADRFLNANPDSPYSARVRTLTGR